MEKRERQNERIIEVKKKKANTNGEKSEKQIRNE